MIYCYTRFCRALPVALLLAPLAALAQAPVITGITPLANARAAAPAGPLTVSFSQALTAGSRTALKVHSAQRGGWRTLAQQATVSGSSLTYTPPAGQPFRPGERVQYTVTTAAASSGGALGRARVGEFTTAAGGGGTGRFLTAPASTYLGLGNSPQQVAVGDLNNDGYLDYAIALFNSHKVGIRFNDGTGGFAPIQSGYQLPDVGQGPTSVVLGDMDNDGDLDLVAPAFGTSLAASTTISVRLNDGGGNFSAPVSADPTVGISPVSVAVGDLDGDGDLDIVAANYGESFRPGTTVSVRMNLGLGTFVAPAVPELTVGSRPNSVALGDVDNDGDLDLLCANTVSNTVSIRLNDGTGSFTAPATNPNPAAGSAPTQLATGDVDGDGDLDLVVSNNTSSTVSVLLNNGSGSFAPPAVAANGTVAVGLNPVGVCLGDVDADGDLDLLCTYTGTANAPSTSVSLRLNNGAGVFTAPALGTEAEPAVGSYPTGVTLGDVDNDGDLDLVVANYLFNAVSVRLNEVRTLDSRPTQLLPALTLSPNPSPAGSPVQVTGATAGASVVVVDVLGRVVLHVPATPDGTARFMLPAGLYLLRCGAQVRRLAVE